MNQENTNNRLNALIVLAIYISVFINSFILFQSPFEFYIGYLIFLILLPVFYARYALNRMLLVIFSILLITGMFNIFLNNNTAFLFLKVYTGLLLSYFFYYYVILEFNYQINRLFEWYLKGAYIASIIGVIQFISFQFNFTPGYDFSWILNKGGPVYGGNFGIRINSVFAEPTYLASTLSAAFFVSITNIFRKESFYLSKFQSALIILVYILSFSGVGQAGIFLTVIFLILNFGFIRYLIIAIPIFILMFNFLYNNVNEFSERYDGLIGLFSGEQFKLGKTHGSSFVLYNNYIVTLENFKSNFIFGSGIGSHPIAFDKYSIAKGIKTAGFSNNSADANSMLLRLFSETGLFGVSIFMYIIFKFYVIRIPKIDSHHWLIANSILVMILLNLFRQGHYFLNGFPFFVLMYIYNAIDYWQLLENRKENDHDEQVLSLSDASALKG